jgi:hypothetical protein
MDIFQFEGFNPMATRVVAVDGVQTMKAVWLGSAQHKAVVHEVVVTVLEGHGKLRDSDSCWLSSSGKGLGTCLAAENAHLWLARPMHFTFHGSSDTWPVS